MNFETFDEAYTARLRSGDSTTEAHFVGYFGKLLDLKLRARVRSKDDVEDLKQETFFRVLRLVRSPGGVRDAERLGPLVNSVCNHVMSEQYRKNQRVEPLDIEAAHRIPSQAQSALGRMLAKHQQETVQFVLGELNTRDQKMLRLVFLEEADKDDVCREFGVEREYLRVLLHRAKNAFRKAYAQHAGPYLDS